MEPRTQEMLPLAVFAFEWWGHLYNLTDERRMMQRHLQEPAGVGGIAGDTAQDQGTQAPAHVRTHDVQMTTEKKVLLCTTVKFTPMNQLNEIGPRLA